MSLNLQTYKVVNGDTSSASKQTNMVQAVEDALNNLGSSTYGAFASGNNIPSNQLTQNAATNNQALIWNGSNWVPGGFAPSKITGYPSDATKFLNGNGAWTAPGMTQLYDSVLGGSAANFDITSISSAYTHLKLICSLRSDRSTLTDGTAIRFNNNSGNYCEQILQVSGTTITAVEGLNKTAVGITGNGPYSSAANGLAGSFASLEFLVPNYRTTAAGPILSGTWSNMAQVNTSTGTLYFLQGGYSWLMDSTPLTRITVFPALGTNWVAGSRATLYGLT